MPVRSCRVTIQDMDGVLAHCRGHRGHVVRGRGPRARGDPRQRVGCRDRAGAKRRQGVGRGCACGARGQANGFYEVAGEGGRIATRGERPAENSIHSWHAGLSVKVRARLSIHHVAVSIPAPHACTRITESRSPDQRSRATDERLSRCPGRFQNSGKGFLNPSPNRAGLPIEQLRSVYVVVTRRPKAGLTMRKSG
jgi:hypothetical protein